MRSIRGRVREVTVNCIGRLLDFVHAATKWPLGAAAAPENPIRQRLSVYHTAIRTIASWTIDVLAVLALVQLYGVGSVRWMLASDAGNRIVSGAGTLAVTIGLALITWEGANIAIQNHSGCANEIMS